MKLLVLGSSGLLGNTITKYFFSSSNYETYGILRDTLKINIFDESHRSRLFIVKNIVLK